MSAWNDYLFEIVGEDSDNCGEQFFVELAGVTEKEAIEYALDLFPTEELRYLGLYTPEEADEIGLDTY